MTRIGDPLRGAQIRSRMTDPAQTELTTTKVLDTETTLRQVAERLKLLLDLLQQLNPQIQDPNRLQPGQDVNIPKGTPQPASPFLAAAPALRQDSEARATEQRFEASMNRERLSSMGASAPQTGAKSGEIPPYDPRRGPQITKDMWTEEMLTGELSADLLHNIKDPADFLNARRDKIRRPTDATVRNLADGGSSPVNPTMLATKDQAEAMRTRLEQLGLNPGPVEEITFGGMFAIDYGTDDRRMFTINGMGVGALLETFARNPIEVAERKILDDWKYRNTADGG